MGKERVAAARESLQSVLDQVACGRITRRAFFASLAGASAVALLGRAAVEEALAAGERQAKQAAALPNSFDLIVVGGGSSGCVVAARASENAARSVLLIEAGPTDSGVASIENPSIWFTNIGGPYDWKYTYSPHPATQNRSVLIPRGKVLGGSSSINAMLWVRGCPQDYDHWARHGARGWGWSDVLPYFKKAEDWQFGGSALRGSGGPLRCELPDSPHPIAAGLVGAARDLHLPVVQDINGTLFDGGSLANLNIKDGVRDNAARAYLRPAMSRPNLTVLTGTQALRLIFAGSRCTGVEIDQGGERKTLRAARVVLSAGAIDTPRLLMKSGIGDPDDLKQLGVPVVAGLRGVGKNLHDHPLLMGVNFAAAQVMPLRNNGGGSQVLWRSRAGLEVPDIMVVPIQVPYASPEVTRLYPVPETAFAITPGLMRPQSRGYLRPGKNADSPLEIQPALLAEQADVQALMRAVEFSLELGAQASFKGIVKQAVSPPGTLPPAQLEAFVRASCGSFFHPVGTCRMGVDAGAVVDPTLAVHGIAGLHIADASVMPRIPSSNTHAACVMIGERAAQFLAAT